MTQDEQSPRATPALCETCGLTHGEEHNYECICPNGHWGWVERSREKGYCYVCGVRWPEEALLAGHPFQPASAPRATPAVEVVLLERCFEALIWMSGSRDFDPIAGQAGTVFATKVRPLLNDLEMALGYSMPRATTAFGEAAPRPPLGAVAEAGPSGMVEEARKALLTFINHSDFTAPFEEPARLVAEFEAVIRAEAEQHADFHHRDAARLLARAEASEARVAELEVRLAAAELRHG